MRKNSIKNIGVPMPELVEQKHIVEYLDKKSHSIDQVVSLQKKLIELLRERKNIIINETVTGKVKVI